MANLGMRPLNLVRAPRNNPGSASNGSTRARTGSDRPNRMAPAVLITSCITPRLPLPSAARRRQRRCWAASLHNICGARTTSWTVSSPNPAHLALSLLRCVITAQCLRQRRSAMSSRRCANIQRYGALSSISRAPPTSPKSFSTVSRPECPSSFSISMRRRLRSAGPRLPHSALKGISNLIGLRVCPADAPGGTRAIVTAGCCGYVGGV
ncbi:hypothetical protein B0H17DRAFT_1188960, partial [Mycena rosella]